MNIALPPLLGGLLNSFTVRAEPWVANWLTPIWILGLGALLGIIVVLILWLVGFALSRIEALSHFSENRLGRLVGGIVLGVALTALVSPWVIAGLRAGWQNQANPNTLVDVLAAFAPLLFAAVVVGWGLVVMVSRRTMEELPLLFQEGPLFWVSVAIGAFALYGILGTVLVRDPESMLDSLRRWPQLGQQTYEFQVPAGKASRFEEPEETTIPISLRTSEIRSLTFHSDQSLRIAAFPEEERGNVPTFPDVSADETQPWTARRGLGSPLGDLDEINALYVRNYGDNQATLRITAETAPATPEMLTVPIIGSGVVGLFFIFLVLWGLLPKLSAIAFSTAKSEMNTPLYMLLTFGGAFLLFVFMWLPYNTFGEDIKMLKFTALDAMLFFAVLQAVWSASSSIADEVEGRTALTVLSKPVGRRDFILGKFLGIAWMVLVMFVVFSSVTLVSVAYKPIFDAREGGKAPERPTVADPLGLTHAVRDTGITQDEVNWQICFSEMAATMPAIALIYAETLVMIAVSVAISTRLALVPNIMICLAVYALGHLTPLLVQSAVVAERFEAVIFMGQLIAAVLPVLEWFDAKAAIAKGQAVQLAYVGMTFVYTTIYCAIAMLLALVLFEDRDLA